MPVFAETLVLRKIHGWAGARMYSSVLAVVVVIAAAVMAAAPSDPTL
jgi:hypothetical protein